MCARSGLSVSWCWCRLGWVQSPLDLPCLAVGESLGLGPLVIFYIIIITIGVGSVNGIKSTGSSLWLRIKANDHRQDVTNLIYLEMVLD